MVFWILLVVVSIVLHAVLGVVVPFGNSSDGASFSSRAALLSTIGLVCVAGVIAITAALVRSRRSQSSFDVMSWFLTVYAVTALVVLVLGALIPNDLLAHSGVVASVVSRILGLASVILVSGVVGFFVAVMRSRPSRRLRAYFVTQSIMLGAMLLGASLSIASDAGIPIMIMATITSAILAIVNAPRLPWLQTLSLDKKLRLLWLTGCAVFASVLMLVVYLQSDTVLALSARTLVGGLNMFIGVVHVLGVVVFARLMVSILIALPNSSIVDRRSLEIDSLAQLARLMAESASIEHILARTADLTVRVTQAHGAWAELGLGDAAKVVATQQVHAEYVQSLQRNPLLRECIDTADRAIVIDTLADYGVDIRSLAVRSMIIVPIAVDGVRCATLVAFMTIEYGFHPDDYRVLAAFGDILSIAIEQSRLHQSALERERLQNEADVAREIQTSLLPRSHPDVAHFDLFGVMVPASEVGGDYFDYVRFADGSIGVVIADVAGKGIPAALYMATLKGAVLAEVREATGPADLLYRLSLTLSGQMDKRSYITMSCVQLRPETSTLVYARAGHSPMMVRNRDGVQIIRPKGVAIGLISPEQFRTELEERHIELLPDDVCLLTTDGVTERRNGAMQEIGVATVSALLTSTTADSAKDLVTSIQHHLEDYAQGADAHDDVTIVAIRSTATPRTTKGTQS
jgi:serine phosphatase RsbU (regulator of sigma subunit)